MKLRTTSILAVIAAGFLILLASLLPADELLTPSSAKPPATHIRIQNTRATIFYALVDPNGEPAGVKVVNVSAQEILSDPNVSAPDRQKMSDVFKLLAQRKGVAQ